MEIHKNARLLFFLIALFIAPHVNTFAHGNENSFEKVIGAYFVDIGYTNDAVTNSPLQLDFEIYKSNNSTSTGNKAPFSDVWLRIEKDNVTMLATGIHRPEFGNAGILYVPQKEGVYTIHFRFENDNATLVESSFDIQVASDQSIATQYTTKITYAIIGSLITVLIFIAFSIKRKK